MGFDYLNIKEWKQITREERLFCSHLYHKINTPQSGKRFVEWLSSVKSPIEKFENKIKLDCEDDWEAAFEVCFYRDLLKSEGFGVKDKKVRDYFGDNAVNLIKRTFDLALFSKNTIVIIEAKAAQGLTTKQFNEFVIDKTLINGVFEFIKKNAKPGQPKIEFKNPKIVFVILASANYYSSPAFTLEQGVGKTRIIDNPIDIHALISWRQLKDSVFNDEIFDRADESYTKKKNNLV